MKQFTILISLLILTGTVIHTMQRGRPLDKNEIKILKTALNGRYEDNFYASKKTDELQRIVTLAADALDDKKALNDIGTGIMKTKQEKNAPGFVNRAIDDLIYNATVIIENRKPKSPIAPVTRVVNPLPLPQEEKKAPVLIQASQPSPAAPEQKSLQEAMPERERPASLRNEPWPQYPIEEDKVVVLVRFSNLSQQLVTVLAPKSNDAWELIKLLPGQDSKDFSLFKSDQMRMYLANGNFILNPHTESLVLNKELVSDKYAGNIVKPYLVNEPVKEMKIKQGSSPNILVTINPDLSITLSKSN